MAETADSLLLRHGGHMGDPSRGVGSTLLARPMNPQRVNVCWGFVGTCGTWRDSRTLCEGGERRGRRGLQQEMECGKVRRSLGPGYCTEDAGEVKEKKVFVMFMF